MTQRKENVVEPVTPFTRDELDNIGANVWSRVPQRDVMYVRVDLTKLELVRDHLITVPEIVEFDPLLFVLGHIRVVFQLESRHDFPAWAKSHLELREEIGILGYAVEKFPCFTYPKPK